MKALVHDKYGSPDFLEVREISTPVPTDNQVLVRIYAASINDWDWGNLSGGFGRVFAGLLRPKVILGCDMAGRVEVVGKNVVQFRPGDEVYGDLCYSGFGAFAEYVCVREKALAPKPARMSFAQAAAIPQAAMLAQQALFDTRPLQSGQSILINGAGGGVGTFAIQMAKMHGVEVTGVDSGLKLELLHCLGFDHVIDYTKEDFTTRGVRYDLIVDVRTNRHPSHYVRALNPGGLYVTVGGDIFQLLKVALVGRWRYKRDGRKTLRLIGLKPNRDLKHFNDLFEAGKLFPVIDGLFKLTEAREAFRRFGAAEQKGKIVITIADDGS
jgi:NADPH:quinone reductase-like Zn-dependent oxidoreductase